MEARKCKYCGGSIPPEKRTDSKFCCNSCKANHWEENKSKKIPELKSVLEKDLPKIPEKPLEGLRGVIENKPKTDVTAVKQSSIQQENRAVRPTIIKRETQAYKDALAKKEKAESDFRRVQEVLNKYETGLQGWLNEMETLKYKKPSNRYKTSNVDIMALEDNLWNEVSESANLSNRKKEVQENITLLIENKGKLQKMLSDAKRIYDEAERKLKSVPQYEIVKQNSGVLALNLLKGIEQKKLQDETQPEQIATAQEEEKLPEKFAPLPSNGKIISSRELREMNYKCLNFQGRWKEFFGMPAVVFHLAVHGKPGEGKSTFCIQFADYLAKNFGHVVYISGEEGFSKTLRDKVVNNKIDNPYLFFADISSYEQILEEIPNDKFHFIFIDSLDTLSIDAARLRDLRDHYLQSAFITISQSTKAGGMRGSQEIIHDTDIAAKVEDGIAETTKNRYAPRGAQFKVFPSQEKSVSRLIGEPRNVI